MFLYKDKEWLKNKYTNEKLSTYKIAKLCRVNDETIRKRLHKYNIPIRSKSEAEHLASGNHCVLSQEAIEWINGELLGDGALRSQSKYSANVTYTSKYPEYIKYVSNILKSYGVEQAGKIVKEYHKKYDCFTYHYNSRCYVELLPIRKQWYPEGKKIIPKDIKLTPLTLRQHYIGDGSLSCPEHWNPFIKLCTYGFPVADVEYFLEKLKRLGIKAKRSTRNAIRISAYSTKDFLKYIGSCPVECYQYKWRATKYANIPV